MTQWINARTPEQALGAAGVLKAGGVDLLDHWKEGLAAEPERLVNLRTAQGRGMERIEEAEDGLHVGALVTLATLAADARAQRHCAALVAAAAGVATPQVRALATLGGNLLQRPRCWYYRSLEHRCRKKGGGQCFAQDTAAGESDYHAIFDNEHCAIVHPSSTATALVALGAEARVLAPGATPRERRLPLAELFHSPAEDVHSEHRLAAGEVLLGVRVPRLAPEERCVYMKVKQKQSFDWPLAEVALWLRQGSAPAARLVLGAAAPQPYRALAAEQELVKLLAAKAAERPARVAAVAAAALSGARPLRGNGYKVPLLRELVERVVNSALSG